MHRARPHEEFWYLAGVGAVRRGEGIGSALLRHRLDRVRGPAYLESSKQENIPLYERFGFELREAISLPDGPDLWPMWRTGVSSRLSGRSGTAVRRTTGGGRGRYAGSRWGRPPPGSAGGPATRRPCPARPLGDVVDREVRRLEQVLGVAHPLLDQPRPR